MSRQEAFLQAIREDPDDEELRLVFADWLEEQGDPRGELFRVQCERSKLLDSIELRYYSLEEELEDLLYPNRKEWSGAPPDCIRVGFENGMLAVGLHLEDLQKEEGQSWLRQQELWITQVKLVPYDAEDVQQMLGMELLQDARWLYLENEEIAPGSLESLSNLRELRILELESLDAKDESLADAIVQLDHLTRLEILQAPLSEEKWSFLQELPQLRSFRAEHVIDSAVLKHLSGLQSLRHLVLQVESLADDNLASLIELPGLEELNLSFRDIGSNGIRHLYRIPNLNSLQLEGALTREAIQELGSRSQLEKLRLMVRGMNFPTGFVKHLASLEVRELTLSAVELQKAGLEHLSELKRLEVLDLGCSNVGSSVLRSFKEMSGLRALSLVQNPISGKGIRHLTSLPLLESLNLRDTRVNDDAIPFLIEMPSLKWLDLSWTKVSKKGLESLKEARPNLIVFTGE